MLLLGIVLIAANMRASITVVGPLSLIVLLASALALIAVSFRVGSPVASV